LASQRHLILNHAGDAVEREVLIPPNNTGPINPLPLTLKNLLQIIKQRYS
jgi:hypothetical protein